ncbi:conserved hypothetical protein [Parvibaculum lavamentivorans DS-1]|uniref:Sulfotransferase family protein n=1 Tax=Parvibaculum lavamentivorans (strain DS-1 / DSM 13023 / NCIMB 13966) TaxID=402881 RepID=A7HYD5_PARL1|nr:conserved hypothetical protein [Parvibaculum lavamentivorans DS-1]
MEAVSHFYTADMAGLPRRVNRHRRSQYPLLVYWKDQIPERAGRHGAHRTPIMLDGERVLMDQNGQAARRAILVLGMHRSGTSALTGVLSALGVTAPNTLIRGNEWNRRGYWESAKLYHFHENLLAAAGSEWNDWSQFDSTWSSGAAAEPFSIKLARIVEDEFGSALLFAVKDPRMCRFLPLWLQTLKSLGVQTSVILSLREPMEVAISLRRRDGMSLNEGLLLWLRHTLDAEFSSRGLNRSFVYYDALLADWRSVVRQIGAELTIPFSRLTEDAEKDLNEFVSKELKNNTATLNEADVPTPLLRWVEKSHYAFQGLARKTGSEEIFLRTLDEVRNEFDQYCRIFSETSKRRRLSIQKNDPEKSYLGRKIERSLKGLMGEKLNHARRVWGIKTLLVCEPILKKEYAENLRRRLDRIEIRHRFKL